MLDPLGAKCQITRCMRAFDQRVLSSMWLLASVIGMISLMFWKIGVMERFRP